MRGFFSSAIVGYLTFVPLILSIILVEYLSIGSRGVDMRRLLGVASAVLLFLFVVVVIGRFVVV